LTVSLSETALEFEREVDRLQEWFLTGSAVGVVEHSPYPYAPLGDGCVVSLWDAWSRFVRRLLLTCACGEVQGAQGAIYRPGNSRTEVVALNHLVTQKPGKSYSLAFGTRGEPKWYIVKDSFEIASTLELENGPTIGAALTASQVHLSNIITVGNPASDVQLLRNYVAHKSDANFLKLCGKLPVKQHANTDSFLRSRTSGGSQIFCDWADAMVVLASSAVV
jgi:hypothetical protein